jgi:hypothetical protein
MTADHVCGHCGSDTLESSKPDRRRKDRARRDDPRFDVYFCPRCLRIERREQPHLPASGSQPE